MLFNSLWLQNARTSLSVCQTSISLSDSVRNLCFYFDNNLAMKEHINVICKTAFLEIRRIITIRHYLSAGETKALVTTLGLPRLDYCNSIFSRSFSITHVLTLEIPQQCCSTCSLCTFFCSHRTNSLPAPLVANQISHLLHSCLSLLQYHLHLYSCIYF